MAASSQRDRLPCRGFRIRATIAFFSQMNYRQEAGVLEEAGFLTSLTLLENCYNL